MRNENVLQYGERAKNARSISLPLLRQHYLVAMAMSLDKLETKVQIHHLHVKRFHMVKRLRKSVQYIRRYSTKYAEPRREHATQFPLSCSPPKLLDRSSRKFCTSAASNDSHVALSQHLLSFLFLSLY